MHSSNLHINNMSKTPNRFNLQSKTKSRDVYNYVLANPIHICSNTAIELPHSQVHLFSK